MIPSHVEGVNKEISDSDLEDPGEGAERKKQPKWSQNREIGLSGLLTI
jgi:hypothetical protein